MVVTNYVLDLIETQVLTEFQTEISHIALGDDNTTPTESDTTLGNEFIREALLNESTSLDTWQGDIFLDTADGNGNTIRESGTFNASSAGTMYTHTLTNEIAKTSSIEVFVEENIIVEVINI